MKITKYNTKGQTAGSLITTDLASIVSRMQQQPAADIVKNLREAAMLGRLVISKGQPRYALTESDRLPRLLFSAVFGRNSIDSVRQLSGLLLLSVDCPEGLAQVKELKNRARQVPYTLLAFAGSSGVTLKIVVRLMLRDDFRRDEGAKEPIPLTEAQRFMNDAYICAANIYGALAQLEPAGTDDALLESCRMSYDAALYYNADALPMPVIEAAKDTSDNYRGAAVDDDGNVSHPDEEEQRQRTLLEYHTCLQKAIDEGGGDHEHELQLLADYCHLAHLPEEGCASRAQWQSRFSSLSPDVVRKVFRSVYKNPPAGHPVSQMNEKERIMRSIEDFLGRRYQLRYNVVKQVTEFRANDLRFRQWQPLGDRELRSIVVEEMKEGGESWMNDMRTYIQSAHIADYNPIHEFLAGVGEWDGRENYIEDFARRLPTSYAEWPRYFHRWFLAMVAQALNLSRDFGNSMVPMLIGPQGVMKSTFCKNILPPSLREYYMDDIKMQNAEQVERVLGRMWLVCIDEYNAKTDREQAKIKRLLTEKDVQIRRMRSDQYTMTPRLCSFIATTNDLTPLPSGDGSRRYLCVEVTGKVDMSSPVNYRQLYAQAVSELQGSDVLYWFTSEDERIIQQHNNQYQFVQPLEQTLLSLFEPAAKHVHENLWPTMRIQQELAKHIRKGDVPNFRQLGKALKTLGWPQGAFNGQHGYYLELKNK